MGERRRRREFPEAFEREAVERVRTSGMTIIAVAGELALHETGLRRWIQKYGQPGMGLARRSSSAASSGPSPGGPRGRERAAQARARPREDGARHASKKAALIFGATAR